MISDADKWNAIYQASDNQHHKLPACVLYQHDYLLPDSGTALDLACGKGANAIFLARQGLQTSAWDISEKAIRLLDKNAKVSDLRIDCQVRDVTVSPPEPDSLDVIVVSYFLDRTLFPKLIDALKNGGLLFYQTFIRDRVDASGPRNENYRLARNELLQLCNPLTIRFYQEEGSVGDVSKGLRNEALLIGQKNR